MLARQHSLLSPSVGLLSAKICPNGRQSACCQADIKQTMFGISANESHLRLAPHAGFGMRFGQKKDVMLNYFAHAELHAAGQQWLRESTA